MNSNASCVTAELTYPVHASQQRCVNRADPCSTKTSSSPSWRNKMWTGILITCTLSGLLLLIAYNCRIESDRKFTTSLSVGVLLLGIGLSGLLQTRLNESERLAAEIQDRYGYVDVWVSWWDHKVVMNSTDGKRCYAQYENRALVIDRWKGCESIVTPLPK